MKYLKLPLLMVLFFLFAVSCEKDDEDSNTGTEIEAGAKPTKETISAKWVVSDNSTYKSFEFNESGNYIVVKDSELKSSDDGDIILFGTYTVNNDGTITLDAVGVMTITFNGDNTIDIKLSPIETPDVEIPMSAEKAEEFAGSTKTELLCRSWRLKEFNGENSLGTIYDMTVVFSEAGTYMVKLNTDLDAYYREMLGDMYDTMLEMYEGEIPDSLLGGDSSMENIYGKWRWKDDSETQIEFWDERYGWDENPASVGELSADKFLMSGTGTLEENVLNPVTGEFEWEVIEEFEVNYVFVPESNFTPAEQSASIRSLKKGTRVRTILTK